MKDTKLSNIKKWTIIIFTLLLAFFLALIITAQVVNYAKNEIFTSNNNEIQNNMSELFDRYNIKYSMYSILVEKSTGICYLEHGKEGSNYYSITIMLNKDGTPRIFDPNDWYIK